MKRSFQRGLSVIGRSFSLRGENRRGIDDGSLFPYRRAPKKTTTLSDLGSFSEAQKPGLWSGYDEECEDRGSTSVSNRMMDDDGYGDGYGFKGRHDSELFKPRRKDNGDRNLPIAEMGQRKRQEMGEFQNKIDDMPKEERNSSNGSKNKELNKCLNNEKPSPYGSRKAEYEWYDLDRVRLNSKRQNEFAKEASKFGEQEWHIVGIQQGEDIERGEMTVCNSSSIEPQFTSGSRTLDNVPWWLSWERSMDSNWDECVVLTDQLNKIDVMAMGPTVHVPKKKKIDMTGGNGGRSHHQGHEGGDHPHHDAHHDHDDHDREHDHKRNNHREDHEHNHEGHDHHDHDHTHSKSTEAERRPITTQQALAKLRTPPKDTVVKPITRLTLDDFKAVNFDFFVDVHPSHYVGRYGAMKNQHVVERHRGTENQQAPTLHPDAELNQCLCNRLVEVSDSLEGHEIILVLLAMKEHSVRDPHLLNVLADCIVHRFGDIPQKKWGSILEVYSFLNYNHEGLKNLMSSAHNQRKRDSKLIIRGKGIVSS